MKEADSQLSEEQLAKLVAHGVSKINYLNDLTLADETMKKMSDRELAVVVACYAASLAKLTDLNLHDFLQLSLSAYQGINVEKKEKADG
jgi:hypothetical protein